MDEKTLSQVVASFQRCGAKDSFLERFYEMFVASSNVVAEKFRHTDLVHQRLVLKQSLQTLLACGDVPASGVIRAHLEHVARRHSRAELGIQPELYDLWLDCLVAAVREHDAQYTEDLGQAWRDAMQAGISFMRQRY